MGAFGLQVPADLGGVGLNNTQVVGRRSPIYGLIFLLMSKMLMFATNHCHLFDSKHVQMDILRIMLTCL